MKYARPCDHCGGDIVSDPVYLPFSRTDYWHCMGCGCIWTLDWVLKEKGPTCPMHGTSAPKGEGLR